MLTAQKVWDVLKCTNFGDYHDLYLKTDVLLLADVFENFRNLCLTTYGVDPAHYYTAPGLSWDAMLKLVNEVSEEESVHLQLIDDIDMYQMVGERYSRRHFNHFAKVCESQQPLCIRLRCKQIIQLPDVPRCQQSLWMGYVSEFARMWIRLGG